MGSSTLQVETSAMGTSVAVAPDHPSIQPKQIRLAVEQLAELREAYEAVRADLAKRITEFEQRNGELIAERASLQSALGEAELQLRVVAVQAFNATGNKTPAPGLEVKEFDVVDMDRDLVELKARERGIALVVDWDALEKIVKADPKAWPTASVKKQPRTTIARDLYKAMADALPVVKD